MAAFGGIPFGGSGSSSGSVGVTLASIIMRAYRIAGISALPMLTPGTDQFDEAVAELAAATGTLNLSRLNVFTIGIDTFVLTTQKAFLVGSGATATTIDGVDYGAFDMPRPNEITQGVISINTNDPAVRLPPMYQMDDEEWSLVSLQDVPAAVPLQFYYDGSYDTTTGYGVIYLWPQAAGGTYSVDWYTWQAIPTFATKDDVVALPPGGEDVLVYQLAIRIAALNPRIANMPAESRRLASKILAAWQSHNAPVPKVIVNDAASCGQHQGGGHWDWRIGQIRR